MLRLFTLQNKRLQQLARLALHQKSVPGGIAITPDGKRALVTRDGDSTVTVLNIEHDEVTLAGRDFFTGLRPCGVQIAPNGECAIVGNVGKGLHHASVGPSVEGVAISPDSKLVAAVVQNGSNCPTSFPFYAEHGYVVLLRVDDGKLTTLDSAPIGKWSMHCVSTDNAASAVHGSSSSS